MSTGEAASSGGTSRLERVTPLQVFAKSRDLCSILWRWSLGKLLPRYSGPQKLDHSGQLYLLRLFPSQPSYIPARWTSPGVL